MTPPTPELTEAIERQLDSLRTKLLDLSNRSALLNFRHSDRSRRQLRIVDTSLKGFLDAVESDGKLVLQSLPPPPDEPPDEATAEFLDALETARLTDEAYAEALAKSESDAPDSLLIRKEERALRDRVRTTLGLPARKAGPLVTASDHARAHGIDPSYELPLDSGQPRRFLRTLLFPDLAERKCSGVLDAVRTQIAETGVNTLHAAVGFLEWTDPKLERPQLSPLVLLPREIRRSAVPGAKYEYSVSAAGESTPEPNPALGERLSRDARLRLPAFDPDAPLSYLAAVESAIRPFPSWRVRRYLTIGLFSFDRIVMWHDLERAAWESAGTLPAQGGVASLLGSVDELPVADYADEYDVDHPIVALLREGRGALDRRDLRGGAEARRAQDLEGEGGAGLARRGRQVSGPARDDERIRRRR